MSQRFKKISQVGILTVVLASLLVGCQEQTTQTGTVVENTQQTEEVEQMQDESLLDELVISEELFEGYTLIEVEGGDLSGHREDNVVVDIGYGEREYWAFTNDYGQLVKVVAEEIILQDHDNEPVLSTGRYYYDEAKVPGVESKTLDEGHVIADSLGGVANAYNITPQDSTVNRHGEQADLEDAIRKANGATDFIAVITYPNTTTQIPSYYEYAYTLGDERMKSAFKNGDEHGVEKTATAQDGQANIEEDTTQSLIPSIQGVESSQTKVVIKALDKKEEYIVLQNESNTPVDLTGWKILSVTGKQEYIFPKFTLEANATVKVGDEQRNEDVDFHWLEGQGIWNNSSSDPAEIYNASGELIDRLED